MLKTNRRSILIILFAWLAYMISYLGRADYGACIVEIVNTTGVARASAGMVTSVFSLCNAFGQIASGLILKKISPVKVIGAELFIVAGVNFLLPNCSSFLLMAVLWGINGAMQSTLLCGATQIFMENLKEPWLSRGAVLLNTVGAVGGTINYILTWFLIRYASWQTVFFTVSVILCLTGILWVMLMPKLTSSMTDIHGTVFRAKPPAGNGDTAQAKPPARNGDAAQAKPPAGNGDTQATPQDRRSAKTSGFLSQLTHYGTAFMLTGCFAIGFLRESVSLWIPSYINEVFGLSSSQSIISTVFVPCFQIFGALLGGSIGRKIHNLHLPSCIAFVISGVCMCLLLLSGDSSLAFCITLFVLNAICMTAALTFSLSLFPIRFLAQRQASLYVGIFNFFVHAGDFVASSGIGWLSQTGGWGLTFKVLCCIAVGAAILYAAGGLLCSRETQK